MIHPNLSSLRSFSPFLLTVTILALALVAFEPVAFGQGSANDWFVKSAKDKKEQLQQGVKGGEKRDIIPSVPGMPIPQTDRMKPPSPDFLLAKVKWGKAAIIGDELTQDWNLAPNDMLEFHKKARSKGFKYMPTQTAIQDFSFDPALMPSILLGGVRELNVSPEAINRLRKYVLDGGMIVCDSVYGSPWFYESAKKLFDDMFPESRFRTLPPDGGCNTVVTPLAGSWRVQHACRSANCHRLVEVTVGRRRRP